MKIFIVAILSLFLTVLGNETRFFWQKNADSEKRYLELKKELEQAKSGYAKIEADLNYYLNPDNLEKELRARFNYRTAGEKMLIIVPPAAHSDTDNFSEPKTTSTDQ